MGLDNPIHIAFLLILLLLVFGAKRLPEMGKSLGSGMRGFKDAISGESTRARALGRRSAARCRGQCSSRAAVPHRSRAVGRHPLRAGAQRTPRRG